MCSSQIRIATPLVRLRFLLCIECICDHILKLRLSKYKDITEKIAHLLASMYQLVHVPVPERHCGCFVNVCRMISIRKWIMSSAMINRRMNGECQVDSFGIQNTEW